LGTLFRFFSFFDKSNGFVQICEPPKYRKKPHRLFYNRDDKTWCQHLFNNRDETAFQTTLEKHVQFFNKSDRFQHFFLAVVPNRLPISYCYNDKLGHKKFQSQMKF